MLIQSLLPEKPYLYYYTTFSPEEQQVYRALLAGFLAHAPAIPCSGCTAGQIQRIFQLMRLEIPELFYVKRLLMKGSCGGRPDYTALPAYSYDRQAVCQTLLAMREQARPLLDKVAGASDLEKETAIHDYLTSRVRYNNKQLPASHEAPRVLLENAGVCDGISKAFKYLADRAGLPAIVVVGQNNGQPPGEGHAWDLVQVDGVFYHLDVTFDCAAAISRMGYAYFNLSDREIAVGRTWKQGLPPCPVEYGYYRRAGKYFQSKAALRAYLRRQLKNTGAAAFQLPHFRQPPEQVLAAVEDTVGQCVPTPWFGVQRYFFRYKMERMVFAVELTG